METVSILLYLRFNILETILYSSFHSDLNSAAEHVAVVFNHQLAIAIHPHRPMGANIALAHESNIDRVVHKIVHPIHLISVNNNVPI